MPDKIPGPERGLILRSEDGPVRTDRARPAGIVQGPGTAADSERDAQASSCSSGAALVGHHHALHGPEHGQVSAGDIIEAETCDRTDRAAAARRDERQGLADQHRVDGGVSHALERDRAAMDVCLQFAIVEARDPGELNLAALLDILERTPADRQALRRTGLGIAVEPADDVTQPRRRR